MINIFGRTKLDYILEVNEIESEFAKNCISKGVLFKGIYLNDKKWNGFGIELDEFCHIIFEGEYSNGKLWKGKVKKFDNNGNILYDSDLSDGKRNGQGKEYNSEGKLIFEGQYLDGKRTKGIEYNNSEDNGKNEKKIFNKELDILNIHDNEGVLVENIESFSGLGKEYLGNQLIYEGEFKNGRKHGEGKEYFHEFLIYEGQYKNGKRNGKGIQYLKTDKYFFGMNNLNTINDISKEFDIKSIKTNFVNGEKNGLGKEYLNGKLIFDGNYKNGKKNGIGKEYDLKGNIIFEGSFLDDIRWKGIGKEFIFDEINILY